MTKAWFPLACALSLAAAGGASAQAERHVCRLLKPDEITALIGPDIVLGNILLGQKLSEYHTGYRAWSRKVLERLPLKACSDDFVFDNQMLAQCVHFGFRIGEISCPTKYFPEASSIDFRRSVVYGLGVLRTAAEFRLHHAGLMKAPILAGKKLVLAPIVRSGMGFLDGMLDLVPSARVATPVGAPAASRCFARAAIVGYWNSVTIGSSGRSVAITRWWTRQSSSE